MWNMCTMYFLIFVLFLSAILIRHLNKRNKPAILGIYQQKNTFFYTKWIIMYFILKMRQVSSNIRNKKTDLKLKDRDTEGPKVLHNHPLAIDAVYFNGTSKNGAAIICGVARRPNRICNAFLYLRIEGGELFLSPKLPDTTLQQTEDEENHYHVSGIKIDVVKPMKTWRIQYEGLMKLFNNPNKTVSIKLDANFESEWDHFNYDTDMSPYSMARDIARELWSHEHFEILKRVHQTHYEQSGQIKGKVLIDGIEHDICVDTVRDHTYGKYREWKNFHRYGLHFVTLANGDYITVGKICMPICFSNLTVGFICKKSSKKMFPVSFCDLELYQHGENLTPPVDYAFQFHADGTQYTVQVDVIDSPEFYMGNEHECRVVERIAKFVVNGVAGWGAAEWQYRHIGGKVTL